MTTRRFLDDVNRLFDELVSSPWKKEAKAGPTPSAQQSVWEVQLPARRGDLAVSVSGRTVTVTVTRQETTHRVSAGHHLSQGTQAIEQRCFTLPEGTRVESVQAAFENGMLHLRVHLRLEEGE